MIDGYNNGRRIVCAANTIIWKGTRYTFLGARHFDARMREAIDVVVNRDLFLDNDDTATFYEKQQQGFIDTWGNFHNRKDAYKIAKYHNQIIHDIGYETDELFSEHLY